MSKEKHTQHEAEDIKVFITLAPTPDESRGQGNIKGTGRSKCVYRVRHNNSYISV